MGLQKVLREGKEIWDEGKKFIKDVSEANKNRRKNYETYMGDNLPAKKRKYAK